MFGLTKKGDGIVDFLDWAVFAGAWRVGHVRTGCCSAWLRSIQVHRTQKQVQRTDRARALRFAGGKLRPDPSAARC